MSARRFTLCVDGLDAPLHGVLCDSPAEVDALLEPRHLPQLTPSAAAGPRAELETSLPPALPTVDVRPRGRPSFDPQIASAINVLGPLSGTLAYQARRIVKKIAESETDAALIPKHRTVEDYLLEQSRGNSRGKSRGKSRRETIRRTRRRR